MSIRQYKPRGKNRRGLTSKQALFLYAFLTFSIATQIAYPLVHGEILRIGTLVIVYLAAATMLVHAHFSYGAKYSSLYLITTFLFALGIEQLGSRTGWPFGDYKYSSTLGFAIAGVPIVVPFAWIMMAHPVLVIARKISLPWSFLLGGAALMAWDLFLDPQMVSANRWNWKMVGPHIPFEPKIPLTNAVGWLLAGMALMGLLNKILPKERRKVGASVFAVEIYLAWILFAGIIGNIFFFSTPGVAIIGGVFFSIILLPYFYIAHFGRPDNM
jgi:putative membrane protein